MSDDSSNLRPAFPTLSPAIVAEMIGGVHLNLAKMVMVPILPIKLVNMPRRSEDPSLAKANDDNGMNLFATPKAMAGAEPMAILAESIANSEAVLRVYAAPEFECLSEDGQQWIIAIVRDDPPLQGRLCDALASCFYIDEVAILGDDGCELEGIILGFRWLRVTLEVAVAVEARRRA
jgi:hypothetical protein